MSWSIQSVDASVISMLPYSIFHFMAMLGFDSAAAAYWLPWIRNASAASSSVRSDYHIAQHMIERHKCRISKQHTHKREIWLKASWYTDSTRAAGTVIYLYHDASFVP